jgi:hypothetical protein
MIRFRYYFLGLLAFIAVFLTACATTQIKSVWKDPSYFLHPQRVMVIAVAKEPIYRRILEDEYVLQLKARGTDAIASYAILPDRSQDDQAAIAKMVVQLGADTVLVSRLVSKRTVRVYYPATISHRPHYYGTWPDYYLHGYESINAPGYSTEYEYALMETNLYDARNDKLIWAVTTETGVDSLNQTLIKPYIGTILNIMVEHGLVRK